MGGECGKTQAAIVGPVAIMSDGKKREYGVNKARPSLAHLADKFNTGPPAGYVAGRGRGASGFSQPTEADLRAIGRGRGKEGSSSSAAAAPVEGPALKPGEKLEGEAGDTRELDLSETERFEESELSMDKSEAGNAMEAFSMNTERSEGHFDDDFNFVWKRKGEDPDDVSDAWLGEVDGASETKDKVEKRRALLQRQLEMQQQPKEEKPDEPVVLGKIVDLLEPNESVAAALRRLSGRGTGKGAAGKKSGAGTKRPRGEDAHGGGADKDGGEGDDLEAVLRKQQFEQLTEAADALLRAGRFDIYAEKRETLRAEAASQAGGASGGGAASSGGDADADADAAAAAGIDAQTHASAVASGFAFHAAHCVYWNSSSGMYFDPRSTLYWQPPPEGATPQYFLWDGASGQFVPAPSGETQ